MGAAAPVSGVLHIRLHLPDPAFIRPPPGESNSRSSVGARKTSRVGQHCLLETMANMFGALNRFISRLDSEQQSKPSGQGSWGFQVLSNTNLELSIEPWFDFVIGINGRPIDNPEPNLFTQEVRNCAGTSISLGVYSAKGQAIREQYVQVPPDASALGLSLQYAPLALSEDIYHILDVTANSPADLAGLLPYSDYVVGSPERVIKGENGFPELVESFIGQPLSLYVYNHEYDVVRIVEITPARGWGGEGALGCVLGFGALHRIPAPLTEPTQDPGETLFNAAETPRFSNEEPRSSPALLHGSFQPPSDGAQVGAPELLTPANLSAPPPPTKAAGSKAAKKAKPAGAADLDDLFKEGEEKSKQLEGRGSTPKNASALPPPPKSGPPKAKSPAPVEVEKAQAELD